MLGAATAFCDLLVTPILTLGLPVVMALNMMDVVEKNGDKIDVEGLSESWDALSWAFLPAQPRDRRAHGGGREGGAVAPAAAPRLSFTKSLADAVMQVEGHLGGARSDDGLKDVVCRQDA